MSTAKYKMYLYVILFICLDISIVINNMNATKYINKV